VDCVHLQAATLFGEASEEATAQHTRHLRIRRKCHGCDTAAQLFFSLYACRGGNATTRQTAAAKRACITLATELSLTAANTEVTCASYGASFEHAAIVTAAARIFNDNL